MPEQLIDVSPLRDPERLDALRRSCLLDAPSVPAIDRLARLAAHLLDVPVTLVTLVDADRQFFTSQVGLPPHVELERQTPLSHSFCQYVVLDGSALVIDDARVDDRLSTNPAVDELSVIAYAGVPLRAPTGEVLGSLCAIDHEPRTWTAPDVAVLTDIAGAIMSEIEVRALLAERDQALAAQRRAFRQAERERERLALLADIGEVVAQHDDHRDMARSVAELLVPLLADWCIVEITPGASDRPAPPLDDTDRFVAVGASAPHGAEQILELRALARTTDGWLSPTIDAYRTAAPVLVTIDDRCEHVASGRAEDCSPRLLELLELLQLNVVSAVPLVARGSVIGSVSFVRGDRARGFDEAELALHLEVSRRLAVAVDAARMRESLTQRARAAEGIETMDDGLVLLDADGIVELWNPAAERITGIAESDAIDRALVDVAPDIAAALDTDGADCAPAQTAAPVVELTPPAAAESKYVTVTGASSARGCTLALRDVTAEQALERTRHELIATVSHQLRTPVASILAAGVTLQRDDIQLSAATTAAIIDTVVEQAQRLAALCGDVLLAYRLGSGVHRVHVTDVDLAGPLRELVAGAQLQAGSAHRIVLDLPDGIHVHGDEHALHELFGNLVDNAVKYSPEGGVVRVHASSDDGEVVVVVEDEGIGIPASERERVFERFHRLDPDMARGVGGTGLGLFVVRELARLMGGRVHAEAGADGRGTRMVVHLPRA